MSYSCRDSRAGLFHKAGSPLTKFLRQELIQRAYSLMRRKGSVSSPGYRTKRRDPQPRPTTQRPTPTLIIIENHNQTHNRKSQLQPKPTTRPTPIEQRGESEQKGKIKTGEGYRSVMVERKSIVAHIHEWVENRATRNREEEREWKSGDGDGGGEY